MCLLFWLQQCFHGNIHMSKLTKLYLKYVQFMICWLCLTEIQCMFALTQMFSVFSFSFPFFHPSCLPPCPIYPFLPCFPIFLRYCACFPFILFQSLWRAVEDHLVVVCSQVVTCAVGVVDQYAWLAEPSRGELLSRHRGHLCAFRLVCNLRLSGSEPRPGSPFTLKFLLGHSFLSSTCSF